MKRRVSDRIFGIMLLVVVIFGAITFILPERTISDLESRSVHRYSQLDIENFLNGSYQYNLELVLLDQIVGSDEIRLGYHRIIESTPTLGLYDKMCANRYLYLGVTSETRAVFNCEALVYLPITMESLAQTILKDDVTKYQQLEKNVESYSKLNELAGVNYYFVNDSQVFNFETGKRSIDYPAYMRENLRGRYNLSELTFDNFDEFKELFYKTDHHWNYKGSYQGYKDIAEMLNVDEELSAPVRTIESGLKSYGSHAKMIRNEDYPEDFTMYVFDLPEHKTFLDGEPGVYGRQEKFIAGDYDGYNTRHLYGDVYGADYGEIIFDFARPEKENLLIIANSFSNAVNELIAQHFNKTYVVDLRHYENAFGKPFNAAEYLAQNNISKVLFIMNSDFITDIASNQGLEQ